MHENTLVYTMFLIFAGAALFSTIALYTRQSLLVAYMLLGILLGPWGLKLVGNSQIIQRIGDIGIIFLLFLLGLHLHPQNLWHLLKKTTWITLISSLIFAVVGGGVAYIAGFTLIESGIIAIAMTFSSTIISLKLLPTTVLHHQHMGEVMISVLLLQDLLAILVLLLIHGSNIHGEFNWANLGLVALSLPALLALSFFIEHFVIAKLFKHFDRIREYIFLLAIAWCLGMSVLAQWWGLSYEIGAFLAGVSIAQGPIALYIAESLKPLRDFFLVLFFFSVGASFDLYYLPQVALPAIFLTVLLLLIKPATFKFLFRQVEEPRNFASEIGWRLAQVSEFSLLVGYVAASVHLISDRANYFIQAVTILTFVASSYIVVLRYPTPAALSDKLRRD